MGKLSNFLWGGLISFGLAFSSISLASSDDALAHEILAQINQYRMHHGLSKLAMHPLMVQEATAHSQAMARHTLPFGHTGFATRMQHLLHNIPHAANGAENVAFNYKTAKIVVDGWLHSPGHRQNIMGHYNLTGIGIARDSTGKPYYTQLFLRTDKKPTIAVRSGRTYHRWIG